MKTIFFAAIFCLFTDSLFSQNTNNWDEKTRASYAIGVMIGNNLKQSGMDTDQKAVLHGLDDQESGKSLLTLQEAQMAIVSFQQKTRAELAEKNKTEGETFLATNKNNPGIITLPDGLQYQIITDGDGPMPASGDVVTVNYRGTFLDGKTFDSSKPGQPTTFPLNRVIPGWREALSKMKVGSKWRIFIPSDLAYGENSPRGIPPNSLLIFEVELLSTKTPAPPAPLTSDIIKVPSAEEMKHGAKIETIQPQEIQKLPSRSKTN